MPVHVDRSLRLPESEYFAEPQAKSGIAIHHTVCDSARTTLDIWRRDRTKSGRRKRVATAYVIEDQRDSLLTVIARREKEAAALTGRVQRHIGAANKLRDSVTVLERRRAALKLTVRRIRTTGQLMERLRGTFPELG